MPKWDLNDPNLRCPRPKCGKPRFRPGTKTPWRFVYDLDLEGQIKQRSHWARWRKAITIPGYEDLVAAGRDLNVPARRAVEGQYLRELLLANPALCGKPVELGAIATDGVQLWDGSLAGAWASGFKVCNLETRRSSNLPCASDETMVILTTLQTGHPKTLTISQKITNDHLHRLKRPQEDTHRFTKEKHVCQSFAILHEGDGPAAELGNLQSGAAAYAGCRSCKLIGVNFAGRMCHSSAELYSRGNPPQPKTTEDAIKDGAEAAAWTGNAANDPAQKSGFKGVSALIDVPTPSGKVFTFVENTPHEGIHCLKVTKDHDFKARKGLRVPKERKKPKRNETETDQAFQTRLNKWQCQDQQRLIAKTQLEAVKLTDAQLNAIDRRHQLIRGPPNFIRTTARPFGESGNFTMSESHRWYCLGIGKHCTQGIYEDASFEMYHKFHLVFGEMFGLDASPNRLVELGPELTDAILTWEKVMPVSEHALVVHSFFHILQETIKFAPAHLHWGYVLERAMNVYVGMLYDKAHPERNIVTNYLNTVAQLEVQEKWKSSLISGWTVLPSLNFFIVYYLILPSGDQSRSSIAGEVPSSCSGARRLEPASISPRHPTSRTQDQEWSRGACPGVPTDH